MAKPIFEYDKNKKTWLRNGVAIKDGHRVVDSSTGNVYSFNSDGSKTKVMSKAEHDKLIADKNKPNWGREALKFIPGVGTVLEYQDYKAGKVGLGLVLVSGALDLASLASFGLAGTGIKAAAIGVRGAKIATLAARANKLLKMAKVADAAGDTAKAAKATRLANEARLLEKTARMSKWTDHIGYGYKGFKKVLAAKEAGTAPVSWAERHLLGMGGPREWSLASPLRWARSALVLPIKNPAGWWTFGAVNKGLDAGTDWISDGKYKSLGQGVSLGMLGLEKDSLGDLLTLLGVSFVGPAYVSGKVEKAGAKVFDNLLSNRAKDIAALGVAGLGATYGNKEGKEMSHCFSEGMHLKGPGVDGRGYTDDLYAKICRDLLQRGYNMLGFNDFKNRMANNTVEQLAPHYNEYVFNPDENYI